MKTQSGLLTSTSWVVLVAFRDNAVVLKAKHRDHTLLVVVATFRARRTAMRFALALSDAMQEDAGGRPGPRAQSRARLGR